MELQNLVKVKVRTLDPEKEPIEVTVAAKEGLVSGEQVFNKVCDKLGLKPASRVHFGLFDKQDQPTTRYRLSEGIPVTVSELWLGKWCFVSGQEKDMIHVDPVATHLVFLQAQNDVRSECLIAECLIAECLIAECLIAECLIAECLIAECLIAECLIAECLIAECLITECLITECLITECLITECLITECLITECLEPGFVAKDQFIFLCFVAKDQFIFLCQKQANYQSLCVPQCRLLAPLFTPDITLESDSVVTVIVSKFGLRLVAERAVSFTWFEVSRWTLNKEGTTLTLDWRPEEKEEPRGVALRGPQMNLLLAGLLEMVTLLQKVDKSGATFHTEMISVTEDGSTVWENGLYNPSQAAAVKYSV
ncbi:hypothetical protein ACOMHN_004605 [Nucella lapillus]